MLACRLFLREVAHTTRVEDTLRVGRRTTHAAAMDVDEPSSEVRINPAQGLTVEAVVQQQVLSIFQRQVTPLLGRLMDRLEAMEARQNAERTAPHTTIEAATLGQEALGWEFPEDDEFGSRVGGIGKADGSFKSVGRG